MVRTGAFACAVLALAGAVRAYKVPVKDEDYSRQTCSGMWAGKDTAIEVSFESMSRGQLALVIYEWADVAYLGKVTSDDDILPKTYVCTSDAVRLGYCSTGELGRFILDLPAGKSANDTSFYSARVAFGGAGAPSNTTSAEDPAAEPVVANGLWDNPAGNPALPTEDAKYASPWAPRAVDAGAHARMAALAPRASGDNLSPTGTLNYTQPIHYNVSKTGYYCVAVVPVTVLPMNEDTNSTDIPYHPTYKGEVLFANKFSGQLPASDYPKVTFYFVMFLVYLALGGAWAWLCYKHSQDLLPIQYYLSGLVGFLIVEMIASWVYYRYLNAHGKGTGATAFLFVVAILDAGRNALSFFMLLVVSMGLSVVKESLGPTMIRCQVLTGAHFIFGVLYAVGVVELELESTSALVLLLFVIPLAFTLSGFLLWILYSLNGTITQLQIRKQNYKLQMFTRLYRILWCAVLIIAAFFVVSSLSFSERMAEDYAANSWKYRWWLLDGWLALLYLAAFWSIAYLWRPTDHNRYLAMADEIAQDEDDYDMAALEGGRGPGRADDDDDDAATLVGGAPRRAPTGHVGDDQVVFEIGDEDGGASDIEDDDAHKQRARRLSGENRTGAPAEREGLMGGAGGRNRDE